MRIYVLWNIYTYIKHMKLPNKISIHIYIYNIYEITEQDIYYIYIYNIYEITEQDIYTYIHI